ncbi:MAG: hypothetical protein IMZ59_06140, partial [Actinobacteria bacterium]|nr:hypothetical protein [Actinomycetota bacterium]
MKKSLRWVVVLILSISMIAAFSFAGCKAAAEGEAPAGKLFEGITIWFFTGGPEGCPFGSVVA